MLNIAIFLLSGWLGILVGRDFKLRVEIRPAIKVTHEFNASLKGVVADLLKRAADTPRGGPSFSVRSSTSNL